MSNDPVLLREFAPGDLGFLMSTWLRDLRDADPSPVPDDLWYPAARATIERILTDKSTRCVVAAAADEPREILGYVVAIPKECLWWILVRKGLRSRGLAKTLLNAVDCPPGTPAAWSTAQSKLHLKNPARGRQLRRLPPLCVDRPGPRPAGGPPSAS